VGERPVEPGGAVRIRRAERRSSSSRMPVCATVPVIGNLRSHRPRRAAVSRLVVLDVFCSRTPSVALIGWSPGSITRASGSGRRGLRRIDGLRGHAGLSHDGERPVGRAPRQRVTSSQGSAAPRATVALVRPGRTSVVRNARNRVVPSEGATQKRIDVLVR
jgi:hypothetical protein